MASTETTLFRGACPHDCPDTCATVTEVRDGRAVRFYADREHPVVRSFFIRDAQVTEEELTIG